MNPLVAYLLGVITPGAAWLALVLGDAAVRAIGRWRSGTCWLCARRLPWGPPRLVQRLHSRVYHGLAVTVRGRIRRRQWHGLASRVAQAHGVSREEWEAAYVQRYGADWREKLGNARRSR